MPRQQAQRQAYFDKGFLLAEELIDRVWIERLLAVTDEIDEKQKMFDGFNHYLYELRRSNLGPIM